MEATTTARTFRVFESFAVHFGDGSVHSGGFPARSDAVEYGAAFSLSKGGYTVRNRMWVTETPRWANEGCGEVIVP